MYKTMAKQPAGAAKWRAEVVCSGPADTGRASPAPPAANSTELLLTPPPPGLLEVILEVVHPGGGPRQWLLPHQELTIGRTAEADFSFPEDLAMSRIHFVLGCDSTVCRLADSQSSNGTFVNDERVDAAVLRDGDTIRAGNTVFKVSLAVAGQSGSPDATKETPTGCWSPPPDSLARVVVHKESCQAGIVRYSCAETVVLPEIIAHRLSQELSLYVMVDVGNLHGVLPRNLPQAEILLDWLPAELARRWSPVVLAAAETPAVWQLIGDCWGKDALLCLYSSCDKTELLHLLRAVVRGESPDGELSSAPSMTLGYYRPSTLSALIRNGSPQLWQGLFAVVRAILAEGEPSWQVFAPPDFEASLSHQQIFCAVSSKVHE